MMNLRTLKQTILAMGLLLVAFTANADKLDLSEGTMTTGGTAAFVIQQSPINAVPATAIGWDINLEFGYFVIDNLAVNLDLSTGGTFTNPLTNTGVGIAIGADYYFDLHSMISPYVAIMPGISWNNGNGNQSIWMFDLPVSFGVLIGLNSHVALDVGASAKFSWGLSSDSPNGTLFGLNIGYVGVRAFF